jgi:hypothetical protein
MKLRALFEKIIVAQLLKNFPAFYGTRKLILILATAYHWTLT